MTKKWSASAPANIALIKYMGKTNPKLNIPTNASLSLTLENLRTFVEIETSEKVEDTWQPMQNDDVLPVSLSQAGEQRFLRHFSYLKKEFGLDGHFNVRSGNNFPSDCGLASSASSFAALTLATYEVAKAVSGADYVLSELAQLSRKGSGSSCRSFFSPWCEWQGERVEPVTGLPNNLSHSVVIVESEKKSVSSSEAHLRVLTSELFNGRVERASRRLDQLKQCLRTENWQEAREICWSEFWDMHALFETSSPHFGYMTADSLQVLRMVSDFSGEQGDGPLVTMDAGANIHLIYRQDQVQLKSQLDSLIGKRFQLLSQ